MRSLHREVIDAIRDRYGSEIEDPHMEGGGKHPKIVFMFRGKRIFYPIASSPKNYDHARMNSIKDLSEMLGEPRVEERQHRSLEEMMPVLPSNGGTTPPAPAPTSDAPKREVHVGSLAIYEGQKRDEWWRVKLIIPDTALSVLGYPQYVQVTRLPNHAAWQLRVSNKFNGLHLSPYNSKSLVSHSIQFEEKRAALSSIGLCGVSPCHYMVVDDTILVELQTDQLKPVAVRTPRAPEPVAPPQRPTAARENPFTPAAPTPPQRPLPPPQRAPLVDTDTADIAARCMAILRGIKDIETSTPYRLFKSTKSGEYFFDVEKTLPRILLGRDNEC